MIEDERKNALLREAAQLDRELVDYVVSRLAAQKLNQDTDLSRAVETKIETAVKQAITAELANFGSSVSALSAKLDSALREISQIKAASAAPPAQPFLAAMPFDETPITQATGAKDGLGEPGEEIVRVPRSSSEKSPPYRLFNRVPLNWLVGGASLIACGALIGYGAMVFTGMKAEAETVCAAYGSLANNIGASSTSFSELQKALKEAKVTPPAESATDEDRKKPVLMALEAQGKAITDLSSSSQTLKTACPRVQPASDSTK